LRSVDPDFGVIHYGEWNRRVAAEAENSMKTDKVYTETR